MLIKYRTYRKTSLQMLDMKDTFESSSRVRTLYCARNLDLGFGQPEQIGFGGAYQLGKLVGSLKPTEVLPLRVLLKGNSRYLCGSIKNHSIVNSRWPQTSFHQLSLLLKYFRFSCHHHVPSQSFPDAPERKIPESDLRSSFGCLATRTHPTRHSPLEPLYS